MMAVQTVRNLLGIRAGISTSPTVRQIRSANDVGGERRVLAPRDRLLAGLPVGEVVLLAREL